MSDTLVKPLPIPVCSIVGDVLGQHYFNHATLERLFYEAGAVGEVPPGNCVTKCQTWLKRMHLEVADPFTVLGKVIEEYMEVDRGIAEYSGQPDGRQKIRDVLARSGLSYRSGLILGAATALPTKTLTEVLKSRDLGEVDKRI